MDGSIEGYKPGDKFEEDTNDPLVDISLTDSTDLWLIQWPIKHLDPNDFHGKEIKLKLRDGTLGSLETLSGKSYDMISYDAQEPNAMVFLPTSTEAKVVGKISRRVCLRRFLEPDELVQSIINPNLSSQRGSGKTSTYRSTVLRGSNGTFGHSNDETPEPSRKNKRRQVHSSSHGSKPGSHVTDTSFDSETKKKKKKIVSEE